MAWVQCHRSALALASAWNPKLVAVLQPGKGLPYTEPLLCPECFAQPSKEGVMHPAFHTEIPKSRRHSPKCTGWAAGLEFETTSKVL